MASSFMAWLRSPATRDYFMVRCPRSRSEPSKAWPDKAGFEAELKKLAGMFSEAFVKYEKDVRPEVLRAGPSSARA